MKTLEGRNPSARGAHIYKGPAERRSGLGRSIVTMVQPAESFLRKDPTRSCGTNPAVRCPLLKSEMRAVLMMVTNILAEQSLQMAFIQRNNGVRDHFDVPASSIFGLLTESFSLVRTDGTLHGLCTNHRSSLHGVSEKQISQIVENMGNQNSGQNH